MGLYFPLITVYVYSLQYIPYTVLVYGIKTSSFWTNTKGFKLADIRCTCISPTALEATII